MTREPQRGKGVRGVELLNRTGKEDEKKKKIKTRENRKVREKEKETE